MQNTSNLSYINSKNVINLKSEILFREAEDDFYYFNKTNLALKKLEMAIELTPCHIKSIMLCADVYFVKGKIKKALELYKRALELGNNTPKCIASIGNCFYSLKEYDKVISYVDKAMELLKNEDFSLYSQLVELKITSLMELKRYKEAYISFIQAQNVLDSISLKNIYNLNYELINEKLQLQKKLRQSKLKIV